MIFSILRKKNSFTLVELLMVIGILIILTALTVPALRFFEKKSDLNNSAEEIVNALRLAQNKTLASERTSEYGVYFDDTFTPHQYILFKGNNYASRDNVFDEVHKLPKAVEIYEIDLVSGGSEVVFGRVTGITSQFGKVSLRLKTDPNKTKTIYIENSGQIGLTALLVPTNGRLIDSRHVHFDYTRVIDTANETLALSFEDPTTTKVIIIADYLKDGQIYWEGEVDVGGAAQKLKIHTHRLNNPDTQFCIHRDRRYNNKALIITIIADGSGSLISYTVDDQESRGTSIYLAIGEAGDPQRQ